LFKEIIVDKDKDVQYNRHKARNKMPINKMPINELDKIGITIIVIVLCITTTIIFSIHADQQFDVLAVNAGLQQCSIKDKYSPEWRKECPDNN
jgi:hypothetical protein